MNADQTNFESDFTPASYRIRVNGTIHNFTNPEPTTREILTQIKLDPTLHVLIFISPNGEKRALALDEEVNLRQPGIEEFVFASTRRVFTIYVDETPIEFDKHDPTGSEILGRVEKHPSHYALTQIVVGAEDQFIDADEKTDLRRPGIEKFTSVPWDEVKSNITIIVNAEAKVVTHRQLSYDQIVHLAFPNAPTGPGVKFTINYSRGCGDKPQGSVRAGESVKVKEGMIFDVSGTNQS